MGITSTLLCKIHYKRQWRGDRHSAHGPDDTPHASFPVWSTLQCSGCHHSATQLVRLPHVGIDSIPERQSCVRMFLIPAYPIVRVSALPRCSSIGTHDTTRQLTRSCRVSPPLVNVTDTAFHTHTGEEGDTCNLEVAVHSGKRHLRDR
jgi:hypothetical protein